MKRLFFLLTLVMGLGSMNLYAQKNKADKRQEETEKALLVKETVQNKQYIIYCTHVYPQYGPSRAVNREYSIEMKGDTLRSYLPYMGVAHSAVTYGGMNVLDFEETVTDYKYREDRKGRLHVSFRARNGEETLDYSLTIYSNGNANVNIIPIHRDPISFSGELELNRKAED